MAAPGSALRRSSRAIAEIISRNGAKRNNIRVPASTAPPPNLLGIVKDHKERGSIEIGQQPEGFKAIACGNAKIFKDRRQRHHRGNQQEEPERRAKYGQQHQWNQDQGGEHTFHIDTSRVPSGVLRKQSRRENSRGRKQFFTDR